MDRKEKPHHSANTEADLSRFSPFSFDILPEISRQPVIEVQAEEEETASFSPFSAPVMQEIPASITKDGRNGKNMPANIGNQIRAAIAHRKEGRLSLLTLERAVEVIEGVENGKTMDEIAREIGTTRQTIWSWMQLLPEFRDEVARAREYQGHAIADDAVKILDEVVIDANNPKAAMAELRKAEQRARIRIELAKSFNFKQYGDKKQNLNLNVNTEISPVDLSKYQ